MKDSIVRFRIDLSINHDSDSDPVLIAEQFKKVVGEFSSENNVSVETIDLEGGVFECKTCGQMKDASEFHLRTTVGKRITRVARVVKDCKVCFSLNRKK